MEGWRLMYRNCHTSYNCGWAYERVEVKASAPPHVLKLLVGVRRGGG